MSARDGLLCSIAEMGLGLCRSVQKPDSCRNIAILEPSGV